MKSQRRERRSDRPDAPPTATVAKALAKAASTTVRPKYGTISAAELGRRIRDGEAITIIDVRLASDFAEGHIDGAINCPFADFDQHRSTVPHGTPIVSVCYRGMLSRTAAQQLAADGHEPVLNLDQGMSGWDRYLAGAGD